MSDNALTDDIRLPFERSLERSVSFEPRAGRVSPRQIMHCTAQYEDGNIKRPSITNQAGAILVPRFREV